MHDIDCLKKRLRTYSREEISFNDPHFTNQMELRGGNKEEVIASILNPDKLVYSYEEQGKHGDTIHCLHFKISNTRTLRLPIIFDKNGRKGLYILTYIMRHRNWQNMIRCRRQE